MASETQKGPLLVWEFIQPAVGLFSKVLVKRPLSAAFGKNQGRLSQYLSYQNNRPLDGAGSGGRTRTVSLPLDFEFSMILRTPPNWPPLRGTEQTQKSQYFQGF
jgi:hypothetical protein